MKTDETIQTLVVVSDGDRSLLRVNRWMTCGTEHGFLHLFML